MSLKIIYLDDEPDLCECFSDEFASEKIEVTTFTDPKRAIAAALESPPDLIFLDFRLPGTTGNAVALAMPKEIPKYLITGESEVNTTYKFEFVFGKPLEIEAIQKVIDLHLKIKSTI